MSNKDLRSEIEDDKSGCVDKMKISQSCEEIVSQENIVTKESRSILTKDHDATN